MTEPAAPLRGLSRREALRLGLLAPLGAAACARDGGAGVIDFWAMGSEGAVAPQLLADFLRASPRLRVDVQALPWTAAHQKLLTAYAGESLPDVSQIGNTWLAELVAIGALAPVPPARQQLLEGHFPAVLETNRIGGAYYGVPWYVDTRLQYYRTDLFERAGYGAPPANWADWKRALHAVKQSGGEGGFALYLPLNEFEQLLTFGLQVDEPLLRNNGSRGNFSSPGFVAALAFYKSLFDEGLAPVVTATQVANLWAEFARGRFAAFISGPWTIGDLKRRLPDGFQPNWGTAGMPGPDGPGASAAGGSSLVVFSRARDPEAAWRLVEHLSQPSVQGRMFALTGDLPAKLATWAAPRLSGDPYLRVFGAQLERAEAVPKVPEWERIVTEMQVVAERMVRGQFTPRTAAAEIDRRADRLLEKRRWMLERGRAL